MAEIKRFSGDTVFNKPIGVVRPSAAGVRAGQAMARIGASMFQAGYEMEVAKQKTLGKETAMKMPIRDVDQNLVYKELPSSLSPVAAQEAQGVIDRRYLEQLNIDIKARATALRLKYDKDPDGFDDAFSTYINTTVENAGRYSSQARDMGAAYAGQNIAAITADKLDFEERKAYNNSYTSIVQQIEDLAARRLNPDDFGDNAVRAMDYDLNELVRANGIIDQFADQYADRISVTARAQLKNDARAAYYGSQLSEMVTKVDMFASEQNPFAPESVVTQQLRLMQDVLRTGRIDVLTKPLQDRLALFGFTEEFLTQDGFARVRDQLASKLAVIEGNKEEMFNSAKAARGLRLIETQIFGDMPIGADKAQTYLDSKGLTNPYDIVSILAQVTKNGADHPETGGVHRILFGKGQFPPSIKALLNDPSVVRDVIANDANALRPLINLWRQSTTVIPFDPDTGLGTAVPLYIDRGLSPEATVFWNTLEAYSNSVRTFDVEGFFSKQSQIDQMPLKEKNASIKNILGDDMTLRDFVIKASGADEADSAQISFMSNYADELLLMHGKERTERILKATAKQVFHDDKLVFGEFPTIYSVDKAYQGDEKNVFMNAVDAQLRRSERFSFDMVPGKDFFLMPDPREGTVFPVYTIVDENGVPFTAGSEVLQVGANEVLAYRSAKTRKTREQLIAEAMEEREIILRNRQAFPQEADFLANIGLMGLGAN